ncbi:Uncharacterised protein [uncultured archaeon]|nr:Uncharacterised protein [uncultured archaeon]
MKKIRFIIVAFALMFFFASVYALENDSIVMNNTSNSTVNDSISANQTNQTTPIVTAVQQRTVDIKGFFPSNVKIGDAQLNINVQNLGDTELTSLGAFVSGEGFSTYDMIPIDSLKSQEKSYILVSGNFRKAGEINLTIRINQEVFYRTVNATDSSAVLVQMNKELEDRVNRQYADLKENYTTLESAVSSKKGEGYDVSGISLSDLKSLIRSAQENILSSNFNEAAVKLGLAQDEYETQSAKLLTLNKISLGQKLKDNAVLFSTLAGAIITFFTLYELLKKKKENIKQTIKSIKIKDEKGNSFDIKTK